MRGEFIRGWDDGRGVDAGRMLGSHQDEELKEHQHISGSTIDSVNNDAYNGFGVSEVNRNAADATGSDPNNPLPLTSLTGGDETRPRNIALLYCIKT